MERGVQSVHKQDIEEAIETLTSILELNLEEELVDEHALAAKQGKIIYRTRDVEKPKKESEAGRVIQRCFRTILKYLKGVSERERGFVSNAATVEGINNIMVLVGEAARTLDKHTNLFHNTEAKRVTGLPDYKSLQEFYRTKLAHKVETQKLGEWILGLSHGAEAEKEAILKRWEASHPVVIDLENVKHDIDYELFFIKKQDGTRFYNPRLIRNMKLVCDFGGGFEADEDYDVLSDLVVWWDVSLQREAVSLLKAIRWHLDWFYQEGIKFRKRELVRDLNRAFLALMLAGNKDNLAELAPVKTCREYFLDFQDYFKIVMTSREYQKLLAYPPKKSETLNCLLLETIQVLSQAFFTQTERFFGEEPLLQELFAHGFLRITDERKKEGDPKYPLTSQLKIHQEALKKVVKPHQTAPLGKILDQLTLGECHEFDPIHQENIPTVLYSFPLYDKQVKVLHLPSPTVQEFVHNAKVIEEFKAFLRGGQKVLLFNFQDRTSWKEHARSVVLEELQAQEEFKNFTVVTLSKDTEFYHQRAPYDKDHQAEFFFAHFQELLMDKEAGYYFPDSLKGWVREEVPKLLNKIHKEFFAKKSVLSREDRLRFIELAYLFIEWSLIETLKPDAVSFSCKDSLDVGAEASALFLGYLILSRKIEKEYAFLDLVLFAPVVLTRERGLNRKRFDRFIEAFKKLEEIVSLKPQ